MKGYKSINEFTYDDCFEFLRHNPDSKYCEIVEKIQDDILHGSEENVIGLEERDDEMFHNAKTIADLNKYIKEDFTGASHYLKKHLKEAEDRLALLQIEQEKRAQNKKRAKRIKIGVFSTLAVIALAIACWLTYQPASYISVSSIDYIISKFGDEIQLTYKSDAKNVHVESSDWISVNEITGNRLYARIDTNQQDNRTGVIEFFAHSKVLGLNIGTVLETVKINQESGLSSHISVDKEHIDAAKELGPNRCYKVNIDTDGTSWSIKRSDSWIGVKLYESYGFLEITPEKNTDYVRYGYVYVNDNNGHTAVIEIKQNGNPSVFELETDEIDAYAYGGSATIDINKDSFDELSVDESYDWLSATVNNNRVTIKISDNNSSPRSGVVWVKCGDEERRIDVKQQGYIKCNKCGGDGKVSCPNTWNGNYFTMGGIHYASTPTGYIYCPSCRGNGWVRCDECDNGKILSYPE